MGLTRMTRLAIAERLSRTLQNQAVVASLKDSA